MPRFARPKPSLTNAYYALLNVADRGSYSVKNKHVIGLCQAREIPPMSLQADTKCLVFG